MASCLRTLAEVWGVRRKDLAESSVFAKDSQEMKGTDVQTDVPPGVGCWATAFILPVDLRHPCGRRMQYGSRGAVREGALRQ